MKRKIFIKKNAVRLDCIPIHSHRPDGRYNRGLGQRNATENLILNYCYEDWNECMWIDGHHHHRRRSTIVNVSMPVARSPTNTFKVNFEFICWFYENFIRHLFHCLKLMSQSKDDCCRSMSMKLFSCGGAPIEGLPSRYTQQRSLER